MPGANPKPCPSTTRAVLRPTPGSAVSAAKSAGTSPACSATSCRHVSLDVASLDAEEAEGPQVVLDLVRRRRREGLRRGKPREQGRRDAVDLLVRLLGRQDRGDQELPVGAMVERDGSVRIGLAQSREQPDDVLVRGRTIGGGSGGSHVHL